MTINATWYVTNVSLHNELKVATIKQTPAKFYTRLHSTTADHPTASSLNFTPTIFQKTRQDASNATGLETYSISDA